MTHYWLHYHLPYRCRHSGACCTSGWPIPIERGRQIEVAREIATGRVRADPVAWLREPAGLPAGIAGVLATRADGACAFHRPPGDGQPGCAIHARRPASCEHFPFVCVTDPRGVHVTLSHYCPTAAALLFEDGEACIVEGPSVLADGGMPEGLDAREALPPVDQDERGPTPRLMSWEAVGAWERAYVRDVASDRTVPDPPDLGLYEHARGAAPPPWTWPAAPEATTDAWTALVAPAWAGWAAVVGRYLAARAHASWALHLGRGPADVAVAVQVARTVLQVEAVRQCASTGRPLDREQLMVAIRRSDLLLVHYADPDRLRTPASAPARTR